MTMTALYTACETTGQMYSACLGRYALGFFGVTSGWVSPAEAIPPAEEIASNIARIEALDGISVPASVFDEMAGAARAAARMLASDGV